MKACSWPFSTFVADHRFGRYWGDTVAKVVLHWRSEILRAADAIFM
jgi:hypothetical protein